MAHYFVLQENNQSAAYAFKVLSKGYKPELRKNQREQMTVTGKLDVQVGPNDNIWSYTVKLLGDETGTLSVAAGTIMTATTVAWGDYANLKTLFSRVTPPTNKLRFRDLDGLEFYVVFTGSMKPRPAATHVTGDEAYLYVDILLRGSQ